MLCSYGCGKEAKYQFKNGKWCCSSHSASCPEIRLKNSRRNTGDRKNRYKVSIENKKESSCKFCNKIIYTPGLKPHEKFCYLNPKNKKECPVCGKPIKKYRINKTCSAKCGVLISKNESCAEKNSGNSLQYRLICFKYHGKKCLICKEELIVQAHHLDGNRANNIPENLIPVCPTHHAYCHHKKYWYIIKEYIEKYIEKFKNERMY